MTIPASGPLAMTEIQTEFGGTNPIGLNEYYAGGGLVPAGTTGTYGAVPSSGTLSIQNFYGTTAFTPIYVEDVFSTWLYTESASTQTIPNGIDLAGKGGLVWTKDRTTSGNFHWFDDTVRGAGKTIWSNRNSAQTSYTAPAGNVTSFLSNGFVHGISTAAPGNSQVSWTFREQAKFFDIVTWTGNGANRTIAHNLGSVPGCIMVKRTDTTGDWQVYHRSLANTEYMVLNSTATKATGANRWNSTTPTSTVFSLGTDATVNASGGTYVAYVYAHNAGGFGLTGTDNVISCGGYTGDGVSDGPSITLGFEPQFMILKAVDELYQNWLIGDTMRNLSVTAGSGNAGQYLSANTSDAEFSADRFCPTATGFKLISANAAVNVSGAQYIYIAIRRGPMKVPTNGTKVFAPVARTGTGATAIVTGANFAPDTVIYKCRQNAEILGWNDRLRGPFLELCTSDNSSQTLYPNDLSSFDMNGYTIGNSAFGQGNGNTQIYANWMFGRAPNFFDVVCFPTSGSAQPNLRVAHNLTVVPELIIVKDRSANANWGVYFGEFGTSYVLILNSAAGRQLVPNAWGYTAPTTTDFGINTASFVGAFGDNMVSYLFATCPGVSKVGSYTGNGSTQTINCGFAGGARFVLIKRTNSTGSWYVYDTARGMTTGTDPYLLLNNTAGETNTLGSVTTVTTGFAVNAAILVEINIIGSTYIFLAIA